MERFNLTVLRRFWTIAKAYWFGDEKWKARGLLLLVVVLLLGYTGLSVVLNNKRGVLISSLSAQDESRFWQTILIFLGVLVLYAPLLAGYNYLRDRLGLQWRRWLTNQFVDNYFGDRAFYRLHQFDTTIDNPDQRISEDVRSFTQESLKFLLVIVGSVLEVIAFSGVLWQISDSLVLFLVLYALIGSLVAIVIFGKPLVRLNFEQLKKEANFRFGLVRIRENAEAIAFYRGEAQESSEVKQRFQAAFDNFKRLIRWQLGLDGFTNFYEFIPFILPALVVAPSVFSGELEVGKVSEAQGAFIRVFFSLNVIVARFQSLTSFGAGINRLFDFAESLEGIEPKEKIAQDTESAPSDASEIAAPEQLEAAEPTEPSDSVTSTAEANGSVESESTPTIHVEITDHLALENLTLQTPNRQRTLIADLTLELPERRGILVVGPSGCGKSSLLRAIAGLWNSGSGTIRRPELDHMLFLPQKPYMILGTLRQQLLYPQLTSDVAESRLKAVLQQVNLPDLADRVGGFEATEDWGDVLSLGEQQRITFARILLNQPAYAILDEATSALDLDNEAQLYGHLQQTDTTFLSVGHRRSLAAYHQAVLELAEDQTWQLKALPDEMADVAAPTP